MAGTVAIKKQIAEEEAEEAERLAAEEAILIAQEHVPEAPPPLDFSFQNITAVEDAEREEPREPVLGQGVVASRTGKYYGKCLRMNNNQLQDVSTLKAFAEKLFMHPETIGWIDLSFNELTTVDNVLLDFPNLEILYLHGNKIANIKEVEKLGEIRNLRKLTLHGNEIEKEKGYRLQVLSTLPWLRNFDFSAVTKCESKTAETWRKMNPIKKKKKIEAED